MEQKAPQALSTPRRAVLNRAISSRRRLYLRLLVWCLALAVSSAIFTAVTGNRWYTQGEPVSLALDSFLLAVYCGAFWYASVRFQGSGEFRWALTSVAFFLLLCQDLLDVAEHLGSISFTSFSFDGRFETVVAAFAGLILALAGRTQRVFRPGHVKRAAQYALLVAVVIYTVNHLMNQSIVTAWDWLYHAIMRADQSSGGMFFSAFDITLLLVVIVSYSIAVIMHAIRARWQEDSLAQVVAFWGIAAGLSTMYLCSSREFYDNHWWTSTLLSVFAGAILMSGLNRENGRAYRQVQEKIGELEALHAVSWQLVGTGTLISVVEALADALTLHLKAAATAVFLYESEENGLRFSAASGLPEKFLAQYCNRVYSLEQKPRPGFHCGHTVKAWHECEVVVIEDIYADVEFLPWQILATHRGTVVSVPIIDSGEALGVFNLYFPDLKRVPADKVRLYKTIAAAAGAAIRHVQIKQVAEISTDIRNAA